MKTPGMYDNVLGGGLKAVMVKKIKFKSNITYLVTNDSSIMITNIKVELYNSLGSNVAASLISALKFSTRNL